MGTMDTRKMMDGLNDDFPMIGSVPLLLLGTQELLPALAATAMTQIQTRWLR